VLNALAFTSRQEKATAFPSKSRRLGSNRGDYGKAKIHPVSKTNQMEAHEKKKA